MNKSDNSNILVLQDNFLWSYSTTAKDLAEKCTILTFEQELNQDTTNQSLKKLKEYFSITI